jgi:hypothetical protein
VLSFLENRKENKAWYKGARVAVSVSPCSNSLLMIHLLTVFLLTALNLVATVLMKHANLAGVG